MLGAMDDDGKPVDWWFAYKLPHDAKPFPSGKGKGKGKAKPAPTTGFEYLYLDANGTKLERSPHTMDQRAGALFHTLQTIGSGAEQGHIFYNDERVGHGSDDGRKGHTKGVLAFDLRADRAWWLLHSVPRFPVPGSHLLPDDERLYAQTFLCITLNSVETLGSIAEVMIEQQQPQVYSAVLPKGLGARDPIRRLAAAVDLDSDAPPVDLSFESLGGVEFRLLAKNRRWDDDLWTDLVGEELGIDVEVETWRRGAVFGTVDSEGVEDALDALWIDLRPAGQQLYWHYTKDHAKYGTSKEAAWVCVADINRQATQGKRGGGAICFEHPALWEVLASVEVETEPK